jgi:hypothetical protein
MHPGRRAKRKVQRQKVKRVFKTIGKVVGKIVTNPLAAAVVAAIPLPGMRVAAGAMRTAARVKRVVEPAIKTIQAARGGALQLQGQR